MKLGYKFLVFGLMGTVSILIGILLYWGNVKENQWNLTSLFLRNSCTSSYGLNVSKEQFLQKINDFNKILQKHELLINKWKSTSLLSQEFKDLNKTLKDTLTKIVIINDLNFECDTIQFDVDSTLTISFIQFVGTIISNAKFKDIKFIACDFASINFSDLKFTNCSFDGCFFRDGIMSSATFSSCSLTNCSFSNVGFKFTLLNNSDLAYTDFVNCTLENESYQGLYLSHDANLNKIKGSYEDRIILQKYLKGHNYNYESKQIESSLKRSFTNNLPYFDFFIAHILEGNFLTEYGGKPYKAFNPIFILFPIFISIYFFRNRKGEIFLVWEAKLKNGIVKDKKSTYYRCLSKCYFKKIKMFNLIMQFTLTKTINLKLPILKDVSYLQIYNLLQTRNTIFEVVGKARLISNLQYLIFLYCLIVFIISYIK